MKIWVGVTDEDWFNRLSMLRPDAEANFWQPSGSCIFRAIESVVSRFYSSYTVLQ